MSTQKSIAKSGVATKSMATCLLEAPPSMMEIREGRGEAELDASTLEVTDPVNVETPGTFKDRGVGDTLPEEAETVTQFPLWHTTVSVVVTGAPVLAEETISVTKVTVVSFKALEIEALCLVTMLEAV